MSLCKIRRIRASGLNCRLPPHGRSCGPPSNRASSLRTNRPVPLMKETLSGTTTYDRTFRILGSFLSTIPGIVTG